MASIKLSTFQRKGIKLVQRGVVNFVDGQGHTQYFGMSAVNPAKSMLNILGSVNNAVSGNYANFMNSTLVHGYLESATIFSLRRPPNNGGLNVQVSWEIVEFY